MMARKVISRQSSVTENCKLITDNSRPVPVRPDYWLRENHPLNRPQFDFEKRKNALILGIVGRIERNLVKGLEVDAITVAVTEWAGAQFAPHVKVIKPGSKRRGNDGVLFLECENPVYKFELSRRLSVLSSQLSACGIKKVVIR
jgi:hypothetical protein